MDVESVDLGTVSPEIRVRDPQGRTKMQGRVEEMQWIVDNVNKQKAYRASSKQKFRGADFDAILDRRRRAVKEKCCQPSAKDPLANRPRWRY